MAIGSFGCGSSGPSRRPGRRSTALRTSTRTSTWPTSARRPGPTRRSLRDRLSGTRPLHTQLRDQKVIAGIGRTWVDDILWSAQLSPFKRGNDLTDAEYDALDAAIRTELSRAADHYAEHWTLPLPDKQVKVARIHAHQGEPCPRCGTLLEAVFFEDYVMTYCPTDQTGGRVLKDRRLSRLLK